MQEDWEFGFDDLLPDEGKENPRGEEPLAAREHDEEEDDLQAGDLERC
jgi:hypothetical protein